MGLSQIVSRANPAEQGLKRRVPWCILENYAFVSRANPAEQGLKQIVLRALRITQEVSQELIQQNKD